jgi:hypothetical protein
MIDAVYLRDYVMLRPRTYKTGYFQCLLKPKFEASADLVI